MEEELSLLGVLCHGKKRALSKYSCVTQGASFFVPFIISLLYLIYPAAHELIFYEQQHKVAHFGGFQMITRAHTIIT